MVVFYYCYYHINGEIKIYISRFVQRRENARASESQFRRKVDIAPLRCQPSRHSQSANLRQDIIMPYWNIPTIGISHTAYTQSTNSDHAECKSR